MARPLSRIAIAALALGTAVTATPALAQSSALPPGPVAAPADPARLEVARRVLTKLMPEGSYAELTRQAMGSSFDMAVNSIDDLPIAEIAVIGGLTHDEAKALGNQRIGEIMEIYDPHWKTRMKATMDAFGRMIGDLVTEYEPKFREAMANGYSAEFTLAELTELDRFFATPAGAHYASRSLALFMSPTVMKSMTDEMMPAMMKRIPDMMALSEKATKDIPPPRKVEDLTPQERKRLAELLGVNEDELKDSAGAGAGAADEQETVTPAVH